MGFSGCTVRRVNHSHPRFAEHLRYGLPQPFFILHQKNRRSAVWLAQSVRASLGIRGTVGHSIMTIQFAQ
jgi:hypothetical protein